MKYNNTQEYSSLVLHSILKMKRLYNLKIIVKRRQRLESRLEKEK